MRGKSRILKVLEIAEELLLSFDNYFSRHPWVAHSTGLTPSQVNSSIWHLQNAGILDKDLSLRKRPKTVLGLIRKPWDGKWRLVAFDVPEKERAFRKKIRKIIFDLGFRQFQRSVWVSPLAVDSFLVKLLEKVDEQRNFSIFSGSFLNGNAKELVRELWRIDNWRNEADQLIERFFLKNKEKRALDRLRMEFWDLVLSHPKVPLNLLPINWPLKKLARIFLKINLST